MTFTPSDVKYQGAGNPAHEAAEGVLYLNTVTLVTFQQVDAPKGTNWQCLYGPWPNAHGENGDSLVNPLSLTEQP